MHDDAPRLVVAGGEGIEEAAGLMDWAKVRYLAKSGYGAAERNRTSDPMITNQVLYHLSYSSNLRTNTTSLFSHFFRWHCWSLLVTVAHSNGDCSQFRKEQSLPTHLISLWIYYKLPVRLCDYECAALPTELTRPSYINANRKISGRLRL